MRTLLFATVAGLTLSMGVGADAADQRVPVYKAPPPPAPVYSWTGCYAGVGAGYGMVSEELALATVTAQPGIPAGTPFVDGLTQDGRGWLATAQFGCDYQFSGASGGNWVIGGFIDGDWANIKGRHTGADVNIGLQQAKRICTSNGRLARVSAGSSDRSS